VIAAWHVGWKPARQASGADWLAPFAARLLEDPYGVVRYVAHQSLQRLPGFADFEFDFLAQQDLRRARRMEAMQRWQSLTDQRVSGRQEQLIDSRGRLMTDRIEELIGYRNDRPVNISE
jgi:hypothetical protein